MKFMLIARATAESEAGAPPHPELMAAIGKLTSDMMQAGVLLGTGGLAPSSQGALLRLARGRVTVTDGPFAEAKELIGGYAIVRVQSKQEAVEMAKRFLEIHAEVLGPSYETEAEVRQMFDPLDLDSPCQ